MHHLLSKATVHITRLNGCLLLFAVGALFGLSVPLSKLAAEVEAQPIGLALWVNIIVGASCLTITIIRGRMPVISADVIRFVFLWGLVGAVGGDVLLFWIVQELPASTVSILLVCEGFIVFGYVTIRDKLQVNRKNMAGLAVGMFGMVLLISNGVSFSAVGAPVWIILALSVPLMFAAEDLLISDWTPPGVDFVALTGLAAIAGSVMLLPVAWYLDDLIVLSWVLSQLEIAIVCIAISSALGTLLMVRLLTEMGPVYGSQAGYTITFAGIAWSMVLLGERLNSGTLFALLLLLTGLLIVEPRKPIPLVSTKFV
ncbi:DMT family transporter [Granulosicoccus antarcticus]|uniref:EamA domain-containing protein n=1 Tax=Granulosicoccus antarcticus IMCC3135 TaxID=1192854 RepID=A0A2Z2NMT9_9GAMM|nr:DMT family transporter [Granulosicoccus antarcticus]ASJ72696.1 hypothetical protein IMCC3135_13040 [Granulosicoccus antarcticus IMCC3135]